MLIFRYVPKILEFAIPRFIFSPEFWDLKSLNSEFGVSLYTISLQGILNLCDFTRYNHYKMKPSKSLSIDFIEIMLEKPTSQDYNRDYEVVESPIFDISILIQ